MEDLIGYKPLFEEHNARLTHNKQIILHELAKLDDYIDVESFYLALRQHYHISLACVYISLKQFVHLGLATTRPDNLGRKIEFKTKEEIKTTK